MKIHIWLIAIAAAGMSACSNVKPEDCDPNKIGLLKTGLCEASGATAQREQALKEERDSQRKITSRKEAQLEGLTVQQRLMRDRVINCLLYTSPSPRDLSTSRMPSSA